MKKSFTLFTVLFATIFIGFPSSSQAAPIPPTASCTSYFDSIKNNSQGMTLLYRRGCLGGTSVPTTTVQFRDSAYCKAPATTLNNMLNNASNRSNWRSLAKLEKDLDKAYSNYLAAISSRNLKKTKSAKVKSLQALKLYRQSQKAYLTQVNSVKKSIGSLANSIPLTILELATRGCVSDFALEGLFEKRLRPAGGHAEKAIVAKKELVRALFYNVKIYTPVRLR